MKFRIDVAGLSKEVDNMFDLLTVWKALRAAGTWADAIDTYEMSASYEWVKIDAQQIFTDMRRLFYGDN